MHRLVAAMLLVGALAAGALAAGCTGDADQATSSLLVQTAGGGGFAGTSDELTLTLRPVSPVTTTFSERPERDSGAITTAEFVSTFDRAFGDAPPNATVSSLERSRGEFTVELSDPRYDEAARTLTYAVRPIGTEGSDLPRRFGPVSVFIDSTDIKITYKNESNDEGATTILTFTRDDPEISP